MTITSHAMVMYSSTGIYMFTFGLIIGNSMHKLEYLGVSLYLVGVFLMLTDPFAVKIGAEGNQYMGDLIAFVGASAGAMLGYYNSKTSKAIHPLVFLTHVILISAFYQIVLLCFLFGPSKVLSTDVGYGAFGWLADSQTFWFLILFAAPFNGYLNLVTLFISYYYWPMQIIASTILIVPFASQIVGIVMGQDNIPGFRTILGLFIIASGSFISSYGARLKAIQQIFYLTKMKTIES